jgi:excisionase family DNA binding protein
MLHDRTSQHHDLLRQEEAARILNVTSRALEAWRHRGGGPRYIRISGRCIRYRQADLHAWLAERERSSTSAA